MKGVMKRLVFVPLRRILTYFDALITKIIMKVGTNLIFMVKTIKNKLWFFMFILGNTKNFEKCFKQKL